MIDLAINILAISGHQVTRFLLFIEFDLRVVTIIETLISWDFLNDFVLPKYLIIFLVNVIGNNPHINADVMPPCGPVLTSVYLSL